MEIKDKVYKIELTQAEVDLIYSVLGQTYDGAACEGHWLTNYEKIEALGVLNKQFSLMSRPN